MVGAGVLFLVIGSAEFREGVLFGVLLLVAVVDRGAELGKRVALFILVGVLVLVFIFIFIVFVVFGFVGVFSGAELGKRVVVFFVVLVVGFVGFVLAELGERFACPGVVLVVFVRFVLVIGRKLGEGISARGIHGTAGAFTADRLQHGGLGGGGQPVEGPLPVRRLGLGRRGRRRGGRFLAHLGGAGVDHAAALLAAEFDPAPLLGQAVLAIAGRADDQHGRLPSCRGAGRMQPRTPADRPSTAAADTRLPPNASRIGSRNHDPRLRKRRNHRKEENRLCTSLRGCQ